MQIAHIHWYDRVKVYFKFNETTGFVSRLCCDVVIPLGAPHCVRLAWCARTPSSMRV